MAFEGVMTSVMLNEEYRNHLQKKYGGISEGIRDLIAKDLAASIIATTAADDAKEQADIQKRIQELQDRAKERERSIQQQDAEHFIDAMYPDRRQLEIDFAAWWDHLELKEFERIMGFGKQLGTKYNMTGKTLNRLMFIGIRKGVWWNGFDPYDLGLATEPRNAVKPASAGEDGVETNGRTQSQ